MLVAFNENIKTANTFTLNLYQNVSWKFEWNKEKLFLRNSEMIYER